MSLKHMLLGIIKDQPHSGYDLNKFFKQVAHYFWSADQSRIYRALHDMHTGGWVAIEVVEQNDNPDKKLYHITPQGRAALHDWLVTPPPPQPERSPWLGQLFFGDELTTDELVGLLEARIARLRVDLDELERRQATGSAIGVTRDPSLPRKRRLGALTLDYGIAAYRFEVEWAERAIHAIRAGDGVAPSGGPSLSTTDTV